MPSLPDVQLLNRASPDGDYPVDGIRTYTASDQNSLHYVVVPTEVRRAQLLYLHGIESHGGWFVPVAKRLATHGIETVLMDRRGSGINIQASIPPSGLHQDQLLEDTHDLLPHLGSVPRTLLGLSWGGVLATAATLRWPSAFQQLVLVTPGLVTKVPIPMKTKLAVGWALLTGSRRTFPIPIPTTWFSEVEATAAFLDLDPLRFKVVRTEFLSASRALHRMIRRGIKNLDVPVHLILAEHDRIIDNDQVTTLLKQASRSDLRVKTYDGATHSVQFDQIDELTADLLAILLPEAID